MSKTPVQRAILVDLLVYDDDKAENIGDRTGFHRNTVSKHVGILDKDGYLDHKGGGVYRLTDKGRESARGLLRSGENPYQDGS